MHVLSLKRLAAFWAIHPPAKGPLSKWHSAVEGAVWTCFSDVKKTYKRADTVKDFVVFDVNQYRIIATVRYRFGKVYIAHVFTHEEYDRWKP